MYLSMLYLLNELTSLSFIITFFVSCYGFWLKVFLSDIIIAPSALFWFLFEWNTFFHSSTLSLCVSLMMKFGLDCSLFYECDGN